MLPKHSRWITSEVVPTFNIHNHIYQPTNVDANALFKILSSISPHSGLTTILFWPISGVHGRITFSDSASSLAKTSCALFQQNMFSEQTPALPFYRVLVSLLDKKKWSVPGFMTGPRVTNQNLGEVAKKFAAPSKKHLNHSFPLKIPASYGFNHGFQVVRNGFPPSTVS